MFADKRVWLEIPGDDLPEPEDLSEAEVDDITDPGSVGVPELSPTRTMQSLIGRLERSACELSGEEQLVARARVAFELSSIDPHRAKSLVDEVKGAAEEGGHLRAQAEAYRAYVRLPWYLLGITLDQRRHYIQTGIELFSHLGLELQTAEFLLWRAFDAHSILGGPKSAVRGLYEAMMIARDPRSGEDEYLRHRILGAASRMLSRIAWQTERSVLLARQYASIAILHMRLTEAPMSVAQVHEVLAEQFGDRADHRAAREHHLRSATILRHHGAWNSCLLAHQRAAFQQIMYGDIDGAQKSLDRLKHLSDEKGLEDNPFSVPFIEGRIHLAREEWPPAIELLEPLIELEAVTTRTKIAIAEDVARALQRLGRFEDATRMLQNALSEQSRLHEDQMGSRVNQFRLSDEMRALKQRADRSDAFIRAVLPATAYREFMETGACQARYFDRVAVFYSDFVGFTRIARGIPPRQLMDALGELFDRFDTIMFAHGCERIEVIGDAYLAVSGLDDADDSPVRMADAALEIADFLDARNTRHRGLGSPEFAARIGIHFGSIIGGMVGGERLRYAIFGDAVNTAQRLEAGATPGRVTVSEETAHALESCDRFVLVERPAIDAKGKGLLNAWELEERRDASQA